MTIFEALILGIIQGLTEFLPISSSGHLVIAQQLFGISVLGKTFEVVVHLGTLCSVIIYFWSDIVKLIKSIKTEVAQKYIIAIIIGTIPAVIIVLGFENIISEAFENIKVVAVTLLITGLILLSTKHIKPKLKNISIGRGFLIGVAQGIAIVPGISRSGITISSGMFLGVSAEEAAKFSFLLAIPAIIGAGLLTGLELNNAGVQLLSLPVLVTGFLSALIVGWISIKWLLRLIRLGKLHWFGVYCIIIGLISWMI